MGATSPAEKAADIYGLSMSHDSLMRLTNLSWSTVALEHMHKVSF